MNEIRINGVPIVRKLGFEFQVSEHMLAMNEGFEQKGHNEPRPLSTEEADQVARAYEVLKEIETNPFITFTFDGEPYVEEPPTETWIPDETDDEWLARWRASKNGDTQ